MSSDPAVRELASISETRRNWTALRTIARREVVRIPHPLVTLSTVLLGATIFSLAGFVNAVYAKKFDDVAIVPIFILTPLTYLGGVFYSVKLLPPWAEAATHANPVFYMVNAFRYGLLGTSDVPVWIAYALMLSFVAGLAGLALWLLKRGVGLRS